MLKPIFDNIPPELTASPQWVNWRSIPRKEGGKPTKPPFQPNGKLAKTDGPATWSPFAVVAEAAHRFDGVGYVLTQEREIVGWDFDNCRCPAFDTLNPEIADGFNMVLPSVVDKVRGLNSYTERSPTGKGLHVLAKGNLPDDGKKKGDFEAYQAGRYFTVTGHHVEGCPRTIEPRQAELDALFQTVFGTPEKPPKPEQNTRTDAPPAGNWKERLEKAFRSVNGAKIERLWNGDHSAYTSQSEGDMGLCAHLTFWFYGDPVAIDAAFRASGLYRPKWDRIIHSDGRTYGECTLQAVAGNAL